MYILLELVSDVTVLVDTSELKYKVQLLQHKVMMVQRGDSVQLRWMQDIISV